MTTSIALAGITPSITTVQAISAKFHEFVDAYKQALLWVGVDENEKPLEHNWTVQDITPVSQTLIEKICMDFLLSVEKENIDLLETSSLAQQAGHDFALTCNYQGTGFWANPDIYGGQEKADTLTLLSYSAGSHSLYITNGGELECTSSKKTCEEIEKINTVNNSSKNCSRPR